MKANKKIVLQNGAKIAVVGGGPAGSFFAYNALMQAQELGISIHLDIFEGRDFNRDGLPGCNNCGGIVAESLIQMLSTGGISLPSDVIRRGIKSYTLHLEQGSTEIEAPFNEQRIASMFRGIGPKGCRPNGMKSFDNHLLELCIEKGARLIPQAVAEAVRIENGIRVKTNNNFEQDYDLMVGAVGLNRKAFQLFHPLCPSFVEPKTTRTFICEIQLDRKLIDTHLGNSMHVFLLNLPNIKFGALIPKGNYVTLVLLGANVDKEKVTEFLHTDPVKKCFPADFDMNSLIVCHCYPAINIKGAKFAYADRVVLIGDSSTTKLYKNGIGAAYIAAKAAVDTALLHGISERDFRRHFQPVYNKMERDNGIGKFVFRVIAIVQRSPVLKEAMLRVVINEQKHDRHKRKMSSMLWDTFTGSAPYGDIFLRFFNVRVMASFFWESVVVLTKRVKFAVKLSLLRFKGQFWLKKSGYNAKWMNDIAPKYPPSKSNNIFTDIRYFFLNKPPIKTLIHFDSKEQHREYCDSISQRVGIEVDDYRMLNLHRIGIEVPASFLFDELLAWNGDSTCWPNHLAKVNLKDNKLDKIQIFLFGRSKYLFGLKNGFFGLHLLHLFDLQAIKIQKVPAANDADNARYLLYRCQGGYPIGVFSMYVRTSIPEKGKKEMSQLFLMVGFNFFGKKSLSKIMPIRFVWESIHNRVSANMSNRFKQLAEWRFEKFTEGR